MQVLTKSTDQETLCLHALLAYAARCARRVQSLYLLPSDHPQAEDCQCTVDTAIRLAEEFAAGNFPDPELIASTSEKIIAALLLAGEAGADDRRAAYAANAAYAVIDATRDAIESIHSPEAVERVVTSVGIAHDSAVSANPRVEAEAVRDRQHLVKLALGTFPETGEIIDPGESGPLGPLFADPSGPKFASATDDSSGETASENDTEPAATVDCDILSPPPLDASTKKFREWLRDFKRKHAKLARDREQLDEERLELARQHEELERSRSALAEEQAHLAEEKSLLDDERAELRDRLQTEQDALLAERQELTRAQDAFEVKRAALRKQTDDLPGRIAEIEKTAAELEAQRLQMSEEQQQIEQQQEQLQQRQKQLDKDEDHLNRQLKEVKQERQQLAESLEESKNELANVADRRKQIDAEECRLDRSKRQVREVAELLREERTALANQRKQSDERHLQLNAEHDRLQTERAELQSQQDEFQSQLGSFQDQQNRLLEDKAECARKEAEIHKVVSRLRDERRRVQKDSTAVRTNKPATASVDPVVGLWELLAQLQQDRQQLQSLRAQLTRELMLIRGEQSPETKRCSSTVPVCGSENHRRNTIRPLRLLLEPGLATEMQLAELFDELSKLYRQLGGPGVRFTVTDCRTWAPSPQPDASTGGSSMVRCFVDVRGTPCPSAGMQSDNIDPVLWNRFLSSLLIPLAFHDDLTGLYELGHRVEKNHDAGQTVSAAARRAATAYAAHNDSALASDTCEPGIDAVTRQFRRLETLLRRLADEQHLAAELATSDEDSCEDTRADAAPSTQRPIPGRAKIRRTAIAATTALLIAILAWVIAG